MRETYSLWKGTSRGLTFQQVETLSDALDGGFGMKTAMITGAGVAIASIFAFSVLSKETPDRMAYRDPSIVAQGAELYVTHCASCHGAELQGEPDWQMRDADGYLPAPPHDELGHTWHHPDDQLFAIVKYGTEALVGGGYRSNMVGYQGTLTDAEIRAVLAYIKSTWPKRILQRHDEMNAAFDRAKN